MLRAVNPRTSEGCRSRGPAARSLQSPIGMGSSIALHRQKDLIYCTCNGGNDTLAPSVWPLQIGLGLEAIHREAHVLGPLIEQPSEDQQTLVVPLAQIVGKF